MSSTDPRQLLNDFLQGSWRCSNDLMPAAFRKVLGLEAAYKKLQPAFAHVALTGSGSAFYAVGRKGAPLPEPFTFLTAKPIVRTGGAWYTPQDYCMV